MPAIISDNLKINNCTNFINNISTGNYYTFIGLSNSSEYNSDWETNTPSPIDNLNYHYSYKDTILGVKKITSSDVIRVIPKIKWESGLKYDMYRHDYSSYNTTKVSASTKLYDSKYYVINRDYNVYICLYNGISVDNPNGIPSFYEPTNTSTSSQEENDGYVWKYLYSISPSDILKFDSDNYIPVPNVWSSAVKDSAISGKIETILIEKSSAYDIGSELIFNNVEILGDGSGAYARVEFNSDSYPIKVTVTNGGSGYTFATLNLNSVVSPIESTAIFNVIIPPDGGHGYNLYNELGAFRALVYSRIDNSNISNPDFIEGNSFSRIGIIKDIKSYGSSSLFNQSTGSGVYSIKILDQNVSENLESVITQSSTNLSARLLQKYTIGYGSSDVIKYSHPREDYMFTFNSNNISKTFDPFYTNPDFAGVTTALSSYKYSEFNTSPIKIGSNIYQIDSNFSGSTFGETYFGQVFSGGIAKPDINIKSGEILYVENRSSITRQQNQREDIKIVIEF